MTEVKCDVVQVLNKVESSKEVGAISTHASDMLNDMDQDIPF
jgi:hypothetical protein